MAEITTPFLGTLKCFSRNVFLDTKHVFVIICNLFLILFLGEGQWEAQRGRKRVSEVAVIMTLPTNMDKAGGLSNND